MTSQKPMLRIRVGQISCAVWENEIESYGQTKSLLKASVSRSYKHRDGTWKSSGSFSRNEIPLAIWCLGKALDAIIEKENSQPTQGDDVTEEMVM